MRNVNTLSSIVQDNCAFLHFAGVKCLKLNITQEKDNRRILLGEVYLMRHSCL